MRKVIDIEHKVVSRSECVLVKCDNCGREAEEPDNDLPFEYGAVGGAFGSILKRCSLDGDDWEDSLDLCYDCAEMIMNKIQNGVFSKVEHF